MDQSNDATHHNCFGKPHIEPTYHLWAHNGCVAKGRKLWYMCQCYWFNFKPVTTRNEFDDDFASRIEDWDCIQ